LAKKQDESKGKIAKLNGTNSITTDEFLDNDDDKPSKIK